MLLKVPWRLPWGIKEVHHTVFKEFALMGRGQGRCQTYAYRSNLTGTHKLVGTMQVKDLSSRNLPVNQAILALINIIEMN